MRSGSPFFKIYCESFSSLSFVLWSQAKLKNAAAVYLYKVAGDGKWGEILFDFEAETEEIVRSAERYTTKSNIFARKIIHYIFHHTGVFLSQRIPMIVFAS